MPSQDILIVGASSDIGSCLRSILTEGQSKLFLASRSTESLDADPSSVCKIESYSFAEILRAFEVAKVFFGKAPEAVVCLSGSLILKPAHLTSELDFEECLAANLKAAFATVRAAGKHMTESGGSVVLISSVAAHIGIQNHELIAAAKAGIEGLVRSAACTYARSKIRFNAVAPGLTSTKLSKRITGSEVALKASTAMHPLGRIGTQIDIARAIAFLLDTENSWITGQILRVDGGMSTLRS